MRFLVCLISCVSLLLCADEQILSLGEHGSVRYIYENEKLREIDRLSAENEVMYSHTYQYEEDGRLVSESLIGGLGEVIYDGNKVISPLSEEVCEYDENHNLVKHSIDGALREYRYDSENRMVIPDDVPFFKRAENGNTVYVADSQCFYDDEHQLIKVLTPYHVVEYEYDPYGNRISRTVAGETEYFIYSGNNEIAILDSQGEMKELRIPGISIHQDVLRPVAIETQDGIFAPIHDYQGKIIKLVNIVTKEVIRLDDVDPFGRGIPEDLPTSWIFCGKNYDQEAGLVYFGKRYYSPELRAWLTPDPLKQTANPYDFCLGNPLSYFDPDGQWAFTLVAVAWGAGATITAPIWAPYALATAAGATVGYFGYKAYEHWQEKNDTKEKEPPFTWDDLGYDSSKCPGEGFVWKGRGTPESGKGNWVRGEKPNREKLNPDFDHPLPVGPHWDYENPDFPSGVRIKPDGTWEYKKEKNENS